MYTDRETNALLLIVEKYTVAHVADQTVSAEPKACLSYTFLPFLGGRRRDFRKIFLIYDFILC